MTKTQKQQQFAADGWVLLAALILVAFFVVAVFSFGYYQGKNSTPPHFEVYVQDPNDVLAYGMECVTTNNKGFYEITCQPRSDGSRTLNFHSGIQVK